MRGDQLARQWRVILAIEANPSQLTLTEIAQQVGTGVWKINRDLEALQAGSFSLHTEKVERATKWAFIDTFNHKIPPPFTLTELMSLCFYKDLSFTRSPGRFLPKARKTSGEIIRSSATERNTAAIGR